MRTLAACQVALCVLMAAPAMGSDAGNGDVRQAVTMLKRLERTCLEYDGPNAHKLLNAMTLEAVRLYENANYDPALDSVLLASAMFPRGGPRTYYGLQPRMIEAAVRWPSKAEAKLLPLDAGKYAWVMVAVTNVSDRSLRLAGLRAVVEVDGSPLKNSDGETVESIPPDDKALRTALGRKAAALKPPRVKKGRTVSFPMVFRPFRQWTGIRLVHEPNKIYAEVRNYPAIKRHLSRHLRAQRVAAHHRAKMDAIRVANTKPAGPDAKPASTNRYVLIGYIRNEISAGKFGIQLVDAALAKQHKTFFVRRDGSESARLSPFGSGSIAAVTVERRKPEKGDGVYVSVKPKDGAKKK